MQLKKRKESSQRVFTTEKKKALLRVVIQLKVQKEETQELVVQMEQMLPLQEGMLRGMHLQKHLLKNQKELVEYEEPAPLEEQSEITDFEKHRD